jgi:hypothetical protein
MRSNCNFENELHPDGDASFIPSKELKFQRRCRKASLLIAHWFTRKKVRTRNESIERYVSIERNTKRITGGDKIYHDSTLQGFMKRSPGPVEPKGSSTCPILFSISNQQRPEN